MTDTPKRKTPYVPWSTFVNYLNETANSGVPPVVDRSILSNYSGSVQSILLSALRGTNLIDDDGVPTSRFQEYVNVDDEKRRTELLKECLEDGFPYFFDGSINLSTATPAQFDEQLRNRGGLTGSTLDKAANFFMTGAENTGIELGTYLKRRKPSVRRSTKPKRTKDNSREGTSSQKNTGEETKPNRSNDSVTFSLHPFIQGLLKTLPAEGDEWSYSDRAKWLTLAANAFDLIYEASDDGHIQVTVD